MTDFGIARPLEVQDGETQTGTVLGTCDYISPEQAQGRQVDERTDVYSLGIVLYELLTGEVPFTGENFVAVAMQHINAPPPPVARAAPRVPPRVDAAVEKALAKDPARALRDHGGVLPRARGLPRRAASAASDGAAPVSSRRPPSRGAGARRPGARRRPWLPLARRRSSCSSPAAVAVDRSRTARAAAPAAAAGGRLRSTCAPSARTTRTATTTSRTHSSPLRDRRQRERPPGRPRLRYSRQDLGKPGVGIILDRRPRRCRRTYADVVSTTPGFRAMIRAGRRHELGPLHAPTRPRRRRREHDLRPRRSDRRATTCLDHEPRRPRSVADQRGRPASELVVEAARGARGARARARPAARAARRTRSRTRSKSFA